MKVLVVSDSHGKVDNLIRAVELTHPDYVLHLGDCQRDLEKLRQAFPVLPMEGVPGNCDYGSCDQPERLIELGGVRILMLHGHTRGVKSDVMRAVWAARECGAQVGEHVNTPCRQRAEQSQCRHGAKASVRGWPASIAFWRCPQPS